MEDVSKEVVAVILVIAIVISVLGTWLVLDSATNSKASPPSSGSLEGKTNFEVSVAPIPTGDTESGNVGVKVTK